MKHIARELGVAPSSVSVWVRSVLLSNVQLEALRQANPTLNKLRRGPGGGGAQGLRVEALARRQQWQQQGREVAQRGEVLHLQGVMLYWCEGNKRSNRNRVTFTNGDGEMHRIFLQFLRTYFALTDSEIKLTCSCHSANGFVVEEIERYWCELLSLPSTCLYPSQLDSRPRSSKGKSVGVLPHGICRVDVNRTDVIQHIYGAIQEYGGFQRLEWLR